MVRHVRHSQHVRLVPFQALPGLDPQVQLQFAIEAVDPLVVKWSCKFGQTVKEYSRVKREYQDDETTEVFGSV
jgi:hypothetical protein